MVNYVPVFDNLLSVSRLEVGRGGSRWGGRKDDADPAHHVVIQPADQLFHVGLLEGTLARLLNIGVDPLLQYHHHSLSIDSKLNKCLDAVDRIENYNFKSFDLISCICFRFGR